jgi:hypothetical protein
VAAVVVDEPQFLPALHPAAVVVAAVVGVLQSPPA